MPGWARAQHTECQMGLPPQAAWQCDSPARHLCFHLDIHPRLCEFKSSLHLFVGRGSQKVTSQFSYKVYLTAQSYHTPHYFLQTSGRANSPWELVFSTMGTLIISLPTLLMLTVPTDNLPICLIQIKVNCLRSYLSHNPVSPIVPTGARDNLISHFSLGFL